MFSQYSKQDAFPPPPYLYPPRPPCLPASTVAFNFDLPKPTLILQDYSLDGFTPKPTAAALLELRKRGSGVCAYLSGSVDTTITCGDGACGYDPDVHWWGCCDGESKGTPTGCPIITKCVPHSLYNSCSLNPSCSADQGLTAWGWAISYQYIFGPYGHYNTSRVYINFNLSLGGPVRSDFDRLSTFLSGLTTSTRGLEQDIMDEWVTLNFHIRTTREKHRPKLLLSAGR
ncbi:uncharacterized protein BDZ99DRAFT_478972 [Mytilinidion resinicola]|uniref:Uncharacterized protein n=1 Tax=Mytilinidion resinicola TaxID=574789 RepID=A0A6A6YG12_9PEZI|nr:uncharacterized protein BDZ99DRAFT_478972 [Mytilinidion resinicola]KAF2807508.1 hypothetical protein BDZ99DRAFT_478972 [Mytilinidion resinicola]